MKLDELVKGVSISKALGVSDGNLPSGFSATVHAKIQFDGVPLRQVFAWAVANRVIPLQRVLRDKCKPEFINDLAKVGLVIHANDCGKILKSKADRVAELKAMGMPDDVAEYVADNPGALAEVMANLTVPSKK